LINQKIPRTFNASEGHEAAKKLAELTGRIVTVEGQLIALREELVTVDLELNEAQTELSDVEERLKSLGAVDPVELQQAQDNRAVLAETKARLDASLTKVWELSLPVGLLANYRPELHDNSSGRKSAASGKVDARPLNQRYPRSKRMFLERLLKNFS
jgi:chromosome segregation ATPase